MRYDGETKGAVPIDEIKNIISKGQYNIITDNKLLKDLGGKSYQEKKYPLGEILAELVYEKLQNGQHNWQELKPLYIQPPPGI